MSVKVHRGGKERSFDVELKPPRFLVAEDAYDVKPTYFLYGGLLFVPLSRDLLKTWGSEWWQDAPPEIISIYENEICTASRSEVVVLQKVLADRANQGYHDVEMLVIDRVQGRNVRHLKDLIRIVESASTFRRRNTSSCSNLRSLPGFQRSDHRLCWSARKFEKSNPGILRRFGVPFDRSDR